MNFQHVASLRELGWRVMVLLDERSQVAMPSRPFSVPMVQRGPAFKLGPRAVEVMPEVTPWFVWQHLATQCRLVMHNQNPFYTFRACHSLQAMNPLGLYGALCCSQFTRDALKRWGSRADWQVVRPFELPVFTQAAQRPGVLRKRQIAYMPRNRPTEANLLKPMFISMYPQLADVHWVEISNMGRVQVAQVLAE